MSAVANTQTAVQALFVTNININSYMLIGGDGNITRNGPTFTLPGFQQQNDIAIYVGLGDLASSSPPGNNQGDYQIGGAHCKGSIVQVFSGNTIMKTFEVTNVPGSVFNAPGSIQVTGNGGGLLRESEMSCTDAGYY